MGTYIIRDVQDFLIERWGQKQMRSDVDLQLAAHAKQVRLENAQLREQNRVLREALEEFCKATEYVASRMAYQCGLGAGEWEAFIDQTNYYKQYKQGKAALTATSQEGQG